MFLSPCCAAFSKCGGVRYEAFHLETAGQLDLFVQGGGGEDKVTAFVAGLKAWHGIAHICIITAEVCMSEKPRLRGTGVKAPAACVY